MGVAVPAHEKKGYQPPRDHGKGYAGGMPGTNLAADKQTKNVWQVVDDGFGSSRDFSNITGINAVASASGGGVDEHIIPKDQQATMKREFM